MTYKGQKSRWGETQHKTNQKNIAVGNCQKILTAVGRPAGRSPTVGFPTVRKPVDRDGRPKSKQRESFLCRSTGQVDREKTESTALSRSTGRSTEVHTCTVVHVGRPPGRLTEQFSSASGRPCGRPD